MHTASSTTIASQPPQNGRIGTDLNKLRAADRRAHDWYRFVLSFPPHLVQQYIGRFHIEAGQCVLDPFCGTGTTLVECKKQGVASIGMEANPMAWMAAATKTDWSVDAALLWEHSCYIADEARRHLEREGIEDNPALIGFPPADASHLRTLPAQQMALLLTDSISPLPLHKTLVLIEYIRKYRDGSVFQCQLVALAKALVTVVGNLHFGPEVGVGPAKPDAPVVATWLENVRAMSDDLVHLAPCRNVPARVLRTDARQPSDISPQSVHAVITSPPYPNEKDYTRTTRLESVLLGLIQSKDDLRALKQNLVCSNTRGVYKEDNDDAWVANFPEIQRLAETIEARRIELGKTSGFERLYGRVTRLYFGGMARHLAELRPVLAPGAKLAYVVGDQASYLRVMIRTGQLLAQIAEHLGYKVTGVDLFRTRLATATREQLREEVVLLEWNG